MLRPSERSTGSGDKNPRLAISTSGLYMKVLEQRFGINLISYYGAVIDQLLGEHLLNIEQGRLHLTERGLLLADSVMAELV